MTQKTHKVYLSLGSNIGDRFNNLKQAYHKLQEHPEIQVVRVSDFYQTSPVGGVPQDDFINQAMYIETSLEGEELLAYIHEIEAALLRVREIVWGPRTIDIDILFYDDEVSDSSYLTLPHPEVYHRLFVLIPLKEIMAEDFPHAQKVLKAIETLQKQGEQAIERVGEKKMTELNLTKIESLVRELLIEIGEDPDREGLVETPKRVAKALQEITASTLKEEFTEGKMFPTQTSQATQMVTVNNIPFHSMCEHHMLPFFGTVNVGYLPQGDKIIGLSKIPRLVDYVSKRLNVQEKITQNVADILMEITNAKGVAVVVDARHMCVEMRGVKKINSITRTTYFLGDFNENPQLRNEFLQSLPQVTG